MMKKIFLYFFLVFLNLNSIDNEEHSVIHNPATVKKQKREIVSNLANNLMRKSFTYLPTVAAASGAIIFITKFPRAGFMIPLCASGIITVKKYNDYIYYGPNSTLRKRSLLLNAYNDWKKLDENEN